MKIIKNRRTAVVARNERGDWTVKIDRFAAVLPATGPEADAWIDAGKPGEVATAPERITKLVGKLLSPGRHNPTPVPAFRHRSDHLVQLDGEEHVRVQVTDSVMMAPDRIPREWSVLCDSKHCRGDQREARVATVAREDYQEAGTIRQVTEAAERAAYDARNAHIKWHRETYGIHPRLELDRWIERTYQARVEMPVPDRDEIDRQLSIARAEQAAERKARK